VPIAESTRRGTYEPQSQSKNLGARTCPPEAAAEAESAALLALTPAVALAGSTVFAGTQSLQVKTSLTPNRAGAKGVTLKVHVDYESTVPGQRIMGGTKQIDLQLPEGSHINVKNASVCQFSAIAHVKISEVPKICPKSSVVGGGTFTADARPLVKTPVPGTITLYNLRGTRFNDILFIAHTQFGSFNYFTNDFDNDNDNDPVLDAAVTPGGGKLFSLKTVDLTIHNSSTHKPYITNPATCPKGGWLSSRGCPSPPTERAFARGHRRGALHEALAGDGGGWAACGPPPGRACTPRTSTAAPPARQGSSPAPDRRSARTRRRSPGPPPARAPPAAARLPQARRPARDGGGARCGSP